MRLQAFKHLQVVGLHPTFVPTHPAKHLAVGSKLQRAVKRKFLFVHPVGDAVDDFVELSVFGDLAFGIVIQQLNKKNVVITHKRNLISVGRPHRSLLLPAVAQSFKSSVGNRIYIIGGTRRTTVDALCLGLYQQTATVGRNQVIIETVNLLAHRVVHIKQHGRLLTRLERALHYFPIFSHARIFVSSVNRIHSTDIACRKSTVSQISESNLFTSLCYH